MTIAVAVRTDSAVVFATDSKLTARGIAGLNPDGTPKWVDQTYDNATKVVHDRSKRWMALAAGTINVGRTTATDMIASLRVRDCATLQDEDDTIAEVLDHMNAQKCAFWPIDVMALRMTPEPEILAYPGKTLHHPHVPR